MPYQMHIARRSGYLHAAVTGTNSVEAVAGYLSDVREACMREQCPFVLIEENLAGPSLSTAAIYHIVSAGSQNVRPFVNRIAFVDLNPEHDAELMQFAETVAVNRAVDVRVFPSIDKAERWLLEEIRQAGRSSGR